MVDPSLNPQKQLKIEGKRARIAIADEFAPLGRGANIVNGVSPLSQAKATLYLGE